MVAEVSIKQFAGTPLLALANNANVNGGETLSKTELAIMQQQMKNLGLTFEEYGLKVTSAEMEGQTAKQTRNNISDTGNELFKAYKKQFGSKNDVCVAQTAELKADSIIKTALDLFSSEHPEVVFTPKSLGARPQFTQPQYKNNAVLYAMDLSDWANGVKMEYINATKLSNEALAAMIIDNDNNNTAELTGELVAFANLLLDEVEDGTAQVLEAVKDAEGNIVKTIKNAEGHIVKVVQDSANKVIRVVREEGVKTRNTVRQVGADIINENRYEHAVTRGIVIEEGTKTRNVIRNEAYKNKQVTKRTAKETQEIDAMNAAITERLEVLHFTNTLPIRVGDMQKQIAEANIPHRVKMELLQRVRNQLAEMYVSDSELDDLQEVINKRIEQAKRILDFEKVPPAPEFPRRPEPPIYYAPEYEKLDDENNKNTTSSNPQKKEDICNEKYTENKPSKTVDKIIEHINKKLKK